MINSNDCVFVLVDVQGKLARLMSESERLHQRLLTLIKGLQLFDIPLIWLEQLPDKLGATSEELRTVLAEQHHPIIKQHFSGWQNETCRQTLQDWGRKQVILAGIEAHICVYQTCTDFLAQGFDVHVVLDAIDSRDLENKKIAIKMMQAQGAQLTQTESLLFELQHIASGERFKKLLTLIK
ncbi:isochorismatase [Shewanella mangrovi]|uniref:Isochorismatase n=1 Tax=Shewanella mangrovi TaxID=1515746 RepID=A0A094JGW2_9GAMM|nr:hydrolase [Shewanella mangrovi]KFZ39205.1 isochorismatase [Shewanella mangrovi]